MLYGYTYFFIIYAPMHVSNSKLRYYFINLIKIILLIVSIYVFRKDKIDSYLFVILKIFPKKKDI